MRKLIVLACLLGFTQFTWAAGWECVEEINQGLTQRCYMERFKVPRGWLITRSFNNGLGITFMEDIGHTWKV